MSQEKITRTELASKLFAARRLLSSTVFGNGETVPVKALRPLHEFLDIASEWVTFGATEGDLDESLSKMKEKYETPPRELSIGEIDEMQKFVRQHTQEWGRKAFKGMQDEVKHLKEACFTREEIRKLIESEAAAATKAQAAAIEQLSKQISAIDESLNKLKKEVEAAAETIEETKKSVEWNNEVHEEHITQLDSAKTAVTNLSKKQRALEEKFKKVEASFSGTKKAESPSPGLKRVERAAREEAEKVAGQVIENWTPLDKAIDHLDTSLLEKFDMLGVGKGDLNLSLAAEILNDLDLSTFGVKHIEPALVGAPAFSKAVLEMLPPDRRKHVVDVLLVWGEIYAAGDAADICQTGVASFPSVLFAPPFLRELKKYGVRYQNQLKSGMKSYSALYGIRTSDGQKIRTTKNIEAIVEEIKRVFGKDEDDEDE